MNSQLTPRQIRKSKNTLYVSGIIVIAFSIWSVIRNVAAMSMTQMIHTENGWENVSREESLFVIICAVVVIAIDFAIRLYVGRCAIREAKGQKVKNKYIVWTVFLILLSLFSIVLCFFIQSIQMNRADMIISIVVEITSVINMLELLGSAIRVKRVKKAAATGGK